jgi:hypothetical protein
MQQLPQAKDGIGLSEDVVDLIMLRIQWESSSHGRRDRITKTLGAAAAIYPMRLTSALCK